MARSHDLSAATGSYTMELNANLINTPSSFHLVVLHRARYKPAKTGLLFELLDSPFILAVEDVRPFLGDWR